MRCLVAIFALSAATPAIANDWVELSPYDWPWGLAPYRPAPVEADHPLYRRVAVEPIVGAPGRIGSTLLLVAHAHEVDAAVRTTLDRSNLLVSPGSPPAAILSVRWVTFALPFKIGLDSQANVTVRYELRRADTGQVIFRRDVTTSAKAHGGDGGMRARGTGRAAILENVAGAMWCLEKSAYGDAPENCATFAAGPIYAPGPSRRFVYSPPIPHR